MRATTLSIYSPEQHQNVPKAGDARIEIEFRGVTKRFPVKDSGEPTTAVQSLNLSIRSGEVVSIIGPSGCGKSTLLNMGAGLYSPSEGEVFVGGERVLGPVRKVSFMLQKDLLMPWRSIRRNIELGLEIEGMAAAQRQAIAEQMLTKCHLDGFGDHYPFQLSGGMRQRARRGAGGAQLLQQGRPTAIGQVGIDQPGIERPRYRQRLRAVSGHLHAGGQCLQRRGQAL